ncbi:MAG: galactose oxidase [Candidatus Hydrogenedentes bacterium]|nr:galactose oxidase [Candidatus Hydrogenedentota bacterium]
MSISWRFYLTACGALLLSACATAEFPGTWSPLPRMTVARQETGAAVIGDKLYVSGGLGTTVPPSPRTTMEVFDFTLQTWSFTAPLPLDLDHHMMVAVDGLLYLIGGYSRPGGPVVTSDQVHIYDPAFDSWSTGASMPAPRGGAWAVAIDRKIYCVGGENGGVSSGSLFIYDVDLDSWGTGAPMPTARNHLNAVTDGINVYVLGGRDGSTSVAANEKYIVAEDRWESLAPLPTARAAMACAYLDGRIYCAGGETPMLFAVNEVYNVAGDHWNIQTPMPIPRHGVAAVAYEGSIIAPGGGLVQGFDPTNAVDMFTPATPLPAPSGGVVATILLLAVGFRHWLVRRK